MTIDAGFASARASWRLGDYDAAFAHWAEAHAQLAVLEPFSRDAHEGYATRAIEFFSAARAKHGPHATNSDPTPVFVVGAPRSGTSLCEQILAAHPDVHGAGELHALATIATWLESAPLTATAVTGAADSYLRRLHALAPDKARIVDKMPANGVRLGWISALFPAARVIHCVRDPRDIGLSIWARRFHEPHPYAHSLSDIGFSLGQRDRLMRHWREVLPTPVFTLALEDWIDDFDGTLRALLAFLGLPYADCSRFHELERPVETASAEQVRRPINADGVGRWRRAEGFLAPLIAELERYGLNAAWDARERRTVPLSGSATASPSAD